MTRVTTLTLAALLALPGVGSADTARQTFTGVITDTMCASNHAAMKIEPEDRCVRECVGDGRRYKYALADGRHVYLLSDQATPATWAGRRVTVTGVLYPKTNIIKVERIAAAR